jgi:branched-chain amino acid transport system ATP-binding protein
LAQIESNLLDVKGLVVLYGQIPAVTGIDLRIGPGEIVTLLGSNGAGKSTTLKSILGIQPAKEGRVIFKGRDITRRPTDRIVGSGLALVPEGRGIIAEMSVLDNLELGAYHRTGDLAPAMEKVFQWFPMLKERKNQTAGTLSGGQQQMLAIARAMIAAPDLIMMDEPSLGLAPIVVKELFRSIGRLRDEGQAILLSEQNAKLALNISDRGYVFEKGRCVISGSSRELIANDSVRQAYLGG